MYVYIDYIKIIFFFWKSIKHPGRNDGLPMIISPRPYQVPRNHFRICPLWSHVLKWQWEDWRDCCGDFSLISNIMSVYINIYIYIHTHIVLDNVYNNVSFNVWTGISIYELIYIYIYIYNYIIYIYLHIITYVYTIIYTYYSILV